ncbi:MAG: hypothetical protein OXG68_14720 [Chloroflexi bacterium]|nr:hypothetical protein [Chloroflexota bacterium]
MAVAVKFAGAISGPVVAETFVGSGVSLATTTMVRDSVSVAAVLGVAAAASSVGLAAGDERTAVNSRRSSIMARMAVNVKFAGAIFGPAVAGTFVGSGVALARTSVVGGSVCFATVLVVAVATVSVGCGVGNGFVAVNSGRTSVVARMAVNVKFAGAISGSAVATVSLGSGVALGWISIVGGSVFVAAVLSVAVAARSVGLAVGDGFVAVNSGRTSVMARMAVSVKFAGALSGPAVATLSVGSGVALARTSIVGGSVSVAVVLGVAAAANSVELAVVDGSATVNSRRSSIMARMAVSVNFAGAISGVAVPGTSVAIGVALASTSIGGDSVSVAVALGVAAISVGLAVGDGPTAVNSRRSSSVARMAVSVKFAGAISGVAVATISVGSGVAFARISIVGGSVFVAAVLSVAVAARSVGLAVVDGSATVNSRRWSSVARMAVSVKFAGAISGFAVARTFVGIGVALAATCIVGDSVSVDVALDVAVAKISVGIAVGDGLTEANWRCSSIAARMAVSVKFAGAISGVAVPGTSVAIGVALASTSIVGDSVSVAVALGGAVAAVSVGLAVGGGPAAVNSRRSSIAARMAVNVKFAGAISGVPVPGSSVAIGVALTSTSIGGDAVSVAVALGVVAAGVSRSDCAAVKVVSGRAVLASAA